MRGIFFFYSLSVLVRFRSLQQTLPARPWRINRFSQREFLSYCLLTQPHSVSWHLSSSDNSPHYSSFWWLSIDLDSWRHENRLETWLRFTKSFLRKTKAIHFFKCMNLLGKRFHFLIHIEIFIMLLPYFYSQQTAEDSFYGPLTLVD